jgi:hypothetical protein
MAVFLSNWGPHTRFLILVMDPFFPSHGSKGRSDEKKRREGLANESPSRGKRELRCWSAREAPIAIAIAIALATRIPPRSPPSSPALLARHCISVHVLITSSCCAPSSIVAVVDCQLEGEAGEGTGGEEGRYGDGSEFAGGRGDAPRAGGVEAGGAGIARHLHVARSGHFVARRPAGRGRPARGRRGLRSVSAG